MTEIWKSKDSWRPGNHDADSVCPGGPFSEEGT